MKCDTTSLIKKILCYGVISSTLLMVSGTIIILVLCSQAQSPLTLLIANDGFGSSMLNSFTICTSEGQIADFFMGSGILVLIAIPVSRLGITVVQFISDRDRKYVVISAFVAVVIAISFLVIGPLEACFKL